MNVPFFSTPQSLLDENIKLCCQLLLFHRVGRLEDSNFSWKKCLMWIWNLADRQKINAVGLNSSSSPNIVVLDCLTFWFFNFFSLIWQKFKNIILESEICLFLHSSKLPFSQGGIGEAEQNPEFNRAFVGFSGVLCLDIQSLLVFVCSDANLDFP